MSRNRRRSLVLFLFLGVIGFGSACGYSDPDGLTFAQIDLTYAVETVVVNLSQTVIIPTDTPTLALPTMTPVQSAGGQTVFTQAPFYGNSPTPTQTPTRPPCDLFAFVMDVTVPDGASYYTGDSFTKTWRLRNIGSCEWSQDYSLVFVEGDQLGAVSSVPLPGEVQPQQEVDISVQMTAPAGLGRYRGGWRLRNPSGDLISLPDGRPVYVSIVVVGEGGSTLVYHFADNTCNAQWTSSVADGTGLPCPGDREAQGGYVMPWENIPVEGKGETEYPGIEVRPLGDDHPDWDEDEEGGWVRGVYSSVPIQTGSHFLAEVGCLQGAHTCDVNFKLEIGITGLPWQELGVWHQEFDGSLQTINIDLVDYVGLAADFRLTVDANNTDGDDAAVWFNPRIEN